MTVQMKEIAEKSIAVVHMVKELAETQKRNLRRQVTLESAGIVAESMNIAREIYAQHMAKPAKDITSLTTLPVNVVL